MSQYNAKQLTIDEVINTGFVFSIPDYQRGYRWGKTEVTDLLDDIYDVVKGDKGDMTCSSIKKGCDEHPYCLQPLAFDTENESSNRMIVVDGQQRLTTIFLILNYLEERIKDIPAELISYLGNINLNEICRHYSLEYDDPTRKAVFEKVKNNLGETNTDNIDSYYITQAYQRIVEWGKDRIKDVFELAFYTIKVLYGTSIIWYEIDKNTDGSSNDFFSKTNTGRIPLTNSELIKANLMLDEYCIRKHDVIKIQGSTEEETMYLASVGRDIDRERLQNERIKMARQWDEIEGTLRNDEFWYFLSDESDQYEDTRIDFIFDIVAKSIYPEIAFSNMNYEDFMNINKERGSFTIIARYLKMHENYGDMDTPIGLKVWGKAWDTYMIFREWFENREWYHLIGYLIGLEGGYDARGLLELFMDKKFSSKEQIKKEIHRLIKQKSMLLQIQDGNTRTLDKDEYKNLIGKLNYNNSKNKKEIHNVLLLFNVISVLNDSTKDQMSSRDTFFPFSRYKKEKWNLEHIHAKADGNSFTIESAKEYISYIREMLERIKTGNNRERGVLQQAMMIYEQKRQNLIDSGFDEPEAMKFATQDVAQYITEQFDSDLDDLTLNGIGNMALLDEKTNISYKNAPFFMKRMIIADIVRGRKENVSRFIPLCTRNVFDKAYTRHPDNMLHWTNIDSEEYTDVIAETIVGYFGEKEEASNGNQ